MTASSPPVTILLVEDEPGIRHFISTAMENENWKCFEAETMQRGLIEAGTRKPDVIILDLGLPDGDGKNFIREIRTWSNMPIIVLSARIHESEKVHALDAGADDYLTKPFGISELLARVRASLRRRHQTQTDKFCFGDVQVDTIARLVTKAGQRVHLTPIEYRLLTVLMGHAGRVVTTAQLLKEVWGPSYAENSHYLRIYMGHLRQKLEDEPAQPRYFLTETGIGYRFMLPE